MTDRELSNFEKLINNLTSASETIEGANGYIEEVEAIDKAIDILNMINQWAHAYPEDIFRPVDWEQCHRALRQVDVSGTAMAADCMRYVVTQMKAQMEKMS